MRLLFIHKAVKCMTRNYFRSNSTTSCKMVDPLVTVKQGCLRGAQLNLLDNTPYFSFKGIPYARVPARFLAPEPPTPWQGVYEATKHGPVCSQYDLIQLQMIEGDENCLFLNVYTKSLSNTKLPVMVFIHGGAYMSGSGNSDEGVGLGPEFLLQHDVILVTINYRLEMLGFLCLDTPEVPGNAGMKDQVAALKWVQENIKQFGGDPNNVTLFGESAGSASVTFHMYSPMSKGLFHKAIAQSGVNVADWSQGTDGKERAIRAAKHLGHDYKDTTQLLHFLRSFPATKLAKLTFRSMTDDEKMRGLPIHFAPVVEKSFDNVQAFISEEPLAALLGNKMSNVPLMLGYTSDEALIMLDEILKRIDRLNKHPEFLVPNEIVQKVSKEKVVEFGQRIKAFYSGGKDLSKENIKAISDMLSDMYFVHSAHRFASLYSQLAPTYFYKFSCDTDLNMAKSLSRFSSEFKGAIHADDLFYLFYNNMNKDAYEDDSRLRDIVYRVTKLWTDFAKTGNPTPDRYFNHKWTPYNPVSREYFEIDETCSTRQNAEQNRVDFWNKLYLDAGLPTTVKSNL